MEIIVNKRLGEMLCSFKNKSIPSSLSLKFCFDSILNDTVGFPCIFAINRTEKRVGEKE